MVSQGEPDTWQIGQIAQLVKRPSGIGKVPSLTLGRPIFDAQQVMSPTRDQLPVKDATMEDGRMLPRHSSRLRLRDETLSMPGALTTSQDENGSVASTASRISRMYVADSLRALQERHQKEDEKRHRERELEDLRLRLARAEEHSR
ncbi:MAG: hypothetical protein BJ554DRAFT_6333, partial [Olpidium bornovanus]